MEVATTAPRGSKPRAGLLLGVVRKLRISPGYEELVRSLGLEDPALAPTVERGEVVTDSGSSRVQRFREHPEGPSYYFKVYRYYRLRPMITFFPRRSRARSEYEALVYLRAHGLPGAEPVAWGSCRLLFRLIRSCFVITRGIEGSQDLDVFLESFHREERDAGWWALRRRGLGDLADLVSRMHAVGFFDHDLFFRNILVRRGPAPEDLEIHFIDHPKARLGVKSARARRAAAIFDLACLDKHAPEYFSRSERLRFFKRYLGKQRLDSTDREMLREIAERRERLMAKRQAKLERRARRRARGEVPQRRSW
jgi:hypothetical protein